MNRKFFFDTVRPMFPDGRFTAGQVGGLDAVLDEFEARADAGAPVIVKHQAYMSATAFHETAFTMQPVRETMASTDDKAIYYLDRAYAAGRLGQVSSPYWRKDADGKSWLGRGLVQLTHKRNYEKMASLTGVDLLARPDLAMDMDVAVKIMVDGMLAGSFTGRKLSDYLDAARSDWVNARRIINGIDRATTISGYARIFLTGLKGAYA